MMLLSWLSAMMPPPRDPRGQLRLYGHTCDHPDCLARGRGPGEAECTGHYTRPVWDRDVDPRARPWPGVQS